jgi:hypothetical protein
MRLDPDQLELLAERIAHHLRKHESRAGELLTAAQLADTLGVDVKTVYRHAAELGAIRIGRRLRFDPVIAPAAWQPPAESKVDLLPIGRRRPPQRKGDA